MSKGLNLKGRDFGTDAYRRNFDPSSGILFLLQTGFSVLVHGFLPALFRDRRGERWLYGFGIWSSGSDSVWVALGC
jgi:hypothetical protein